MDRIVLKWKRAHSFVKAQKALRTEFEFQGRKRLFGLPCVYLLTDPTEEIVLRVGKSGDLWEEYKGSKYMIEAALYGSGNLVFVAEAPADERERLMVERVLIARHHPKFNEQRPLPDRDVELQHEGEVPRAFGATAPETGPAD